MDSSDQSRRRNWALAAASGLVIAVVFSVYRERPAERPVAGRWVTLPLIPVRDEDYSITEYPDDAGIMIDEHANGEEPESWRFHEQVDASAANQPEPKAPIECDLESRTRRVFVPRGKKLSIDLGVCPDFGWLADLDSESIQGLWIYRRGGELPEPPLMLSEAQAEWIARQSELEIVELGPSLGFETARAADRLLHAKNLRSLVLEGVAIPETFLGQIEPLDNIERLGLVFDSDTPRTTETARAAIAMLPKLTGLRSLDISWGMAEWPPEMGSSIEADDISQAEINAQAMDDALRLLSQMPQIEELRLEGEAACDVALAALAGQSRLRRLHLISDAGGTKSYLGAISGWPALPALQDLRLERVRLEATAAESFRSLKRLRCLWLDGCDLTTKTIRAIGSLESLEELVATGYWSWHNSDPNLLGPMRQLRRLRVEGLGSDFESLRHYTGLRELSLDIAADARGLSALRALTNLEALELSTYEGWLDDSIVVHLAPLQRLRRLRLEETDMSVDGVERLRKALPKCDIKVGFRRRIAPEGEAVQPVS